MFRSRTSLTVVLAMAGAGLALCLATQVEAMQTSAPDTTDAASSIGPTAAQVAENARIREAIFNGEGGNPRFADYPVTKIYSGQPHRWISAIHVPACSGRACLRP